MEIIREHESWQILKNLFHIIMMKSKSNIKIWLRNPVKKIDLKTIHGNKST